MFCPLSHPLEQNTLLPELGHRNILFYVFLPSKILRSLLYQKIYHISPHVKRRPIFQMRKSDENCLDKTEYAINSEGFKQNAVKSILLRDNKCKI
jgi:hypothetical protein